MKYPPYARQLKSYQATDPPEIFIFMGNYAGWQKAKHLNSGRRNAIVLPLNDDPFIYDWTFSKGIEFLVFDDVGTDRLKLKKLALALLKGGSPCVRIVSKSFEENLLIYKP